MAGEVQGHLARLQLVHHQDQRIYVVSGNVGTVHRLRLLSLPALVAPDHLWHDDALPAAAVGPGRCLQQRDRPYSRLPEQFGVSPPCEGTGTVAQGEARGGQ